MIALYVLLFLVAVSGFGVLLWKLQNLRDDDWTALIDALDDPIDPAAVQRIQSAVGDEVARRRQARGVR